MYAMVYSKPGMFYFQSVSTDRDKMLSCVVHVRERQRSVIGFIYYIEIDNTLNVWLSGLL